MKKNPAEFAKLALAENALSSFNLQQMVNIINQEYGFDLPVAVVKRALGKLKFLDNDKSSYAIKQDAVFIFFLGLHVLLHHWCQILFIHEFSLVFIYFHIYPTLLYPQILLNTILK